jgi:GTPase SAR1 family protein
VKVDRKRIELADADEPLDLLVWDIAGLETITPMVRNYFRGAHGALVVHDVTRPESLETLAEFCEQFLAVSPQAKLVVAGNKCDLAHAQNLAVPNLKKLGKQKLLPHFFTSAKSGENVEAAFLTLAKMLVS